MQFLKRLFDAVTPYRQVRQLEARIDALERELAARTTSVDVENLLAEYPLETTVDNRIDELAAEIEEVRELAIENQKRLQDFEAPTDYVAEDDLFCLVDDWLINREDFVAETVIDVLNSRFNQ